VLQSFEKNLKSCWQGGNLVTCYCMPANDAIMILERLWAEITD